MADEPAPAAEVKRDEEEDEDEEDDGGDLLGELPSAGGSAAASGPGTGKRERVRRFTTHVFRKTPTAGHGHVLAWGWMHKQGQGGLLHRKNWKRRFFVLYSVPQGSVFVYYDKQSVNGDDILGFIDLRRATEVKRTTKTISKRERPVLEIITPSRTYLVAPETVGKRLAAAIVPKLQFILGWPVPEPTFGDAITSDTDSGMEEVVGTWEDLITLQIRAELESKTFDVELVADSTDTLPPRVSLRATPTDIALLDIEDHDQAHTCWSYRDVASWSCPIPNELHISVRIPAAMVRCVFKADNAAEIKALIEGHVNRIVSHQKGGD